MRMMTIDEQSETALEDELAMRQWDRERGLCDYCHRRPSTNPCKFPERHSLPKVELTEPCSVCSGSGQNMSGEINDRGVVANYCIRCQGIGTTHVPDIDMSDRQPLAFDVLREINVSRCARWHSDGLLWNIAEWTNAMQAEAGEAGNVAKKIRRIETNAKGRPSEQDVGVLEAKLGDELADTVIYADLTAAERGIDLSAAIRSKFNRTSEEYGFPERL